MIIHNVEPGSPAWHALRTKHHRTGSVAPAMMGVSKNVKRNELLHMKATGSEQEFSDWVRENILAKGHEYEALARPIAVKIIGEDLYPVTVSDDDGYLLASLDGKTMLDDVIWEHKQPNAELMAAVRAGLCPEYHYWQVVQGFAITGAERCLFQVSDGTEENEAHCWVERNEDDVARLRAAWKQFDEDLAAYVPPEVVPAAVAAPIKDLPAVIYKRDGLALTSNLEEYKVAALKLVEDSKLPMVTDQDFVDRIALCKKFKTAEETIELLQGQVVGELKDINAFCTGLGEVGKLIRQARLSGEKLVEAEKENRRLAIINGAKAKWAEHTAALNARLGKPYMPVIAADFVAAIKGLKNLDSMQNAADTELARAKIEANAVADKIDANLKTLRTLAADHSFLFADTPQIVLKAPDDLEALVKTRIAEHKAAEEKKQAEERERIRQEELARIERENAERAKAEKEAAEKAAQQQPTAPTMDNVPAAATPAAIAEAFGQTAVPAALPSTVIQAPPLHAADPSNVAKINMAIDPVARIRLGELSALLGFAVTADFLAERGFQPVATDKAAKLYRACDVPAICAAISRHVANVGNNYLLRAA
jgi:predicted phage-related endonuclease